jgi:hypothetical protein
MYPSMEGMQPNTKTERKNQQNRFPPLYIIIIIIIERLEMAEIHIIRTHLRNSRIAVFLPKTPTGDRSIPPAKLQDHHQCSDFPRCRFAPTRKGKKINQQKKKEKKVKKKMKRKNKSKSKK